MGSFEKNIVVFDEGQRAWDIGQMEKFAAENGITIVDICEIAKKPGMKAEGFFKHKGVASHPSDAGMAALADAYYKALTEK